MGEEELNSLEERLTQAPLDWELRLAVIQALVFRDQLPEAKRLIRDSPDAAGPAPPQVQHRLHRLMTEGQVAAQEFYQEDGHVVTEMIGEASLDSLPLIEVDFVSTGSTCFEQSTNVADDVRSVLPEEVKVASRVEENVMKRVDLSRHQQELDDSRFVIEPVEAFKPLHREKNAGNKVSALALALLVHVILIVLLGVIVMSGPRPNPPQIVAVNVAGDLTLDVPLKRVERVKRPKPPAASAQTTMVITSTALAPVSLQEFDVSDVSFMPATMIGFGSGAGVSGEGDGAGVRIGNIGGMEIKSRRLGVVLDVSGSMDAQIRAVRREIRKNFSSATVVEVVGCSLDWSEDDPSFDLKKSKGRVRFKKNADSVVEAVEILIASTNVDAIFWFSDLMDNQSKPGLQRLSHLLGTQFGSERRPVKFYVQSVDKEPEASLAGIAKRSGGATKVEKFD